MTADDVTEDAFLGGRLRLRQPRRGHRAGTDAVILAGLAPVRPGDRVADLGSASGAIGLMVALREPASEVVLIERQAELVALARENVRLNALDARVSAVEADAFQPWPSEWVGWADLVVTNPPFFEPGARTSEEPGRRWARRMEGGDLAAWLSAAAALSKPKGRICFIHRADALELCLSSLGQAFGSRQIVPVHARAGEAATRILLTATKGGKAPIELRPALALHEHDGRFTPEAEQLHRPQRGPDDPRNFNEQPQFEAVSQGAARLASP